MVPASTASSAFNVPPATFAATSYERGVMSVDELLRGFPIPAGTRL